MIDYDSPAIVWFRTDQRLSDNPALQAASKHKSVIPLFVWAPEEDQPWEPGGATCWWLHRSLEELHQNLRAKGSALIVEQGDSLEALNNLVSSTKATAVYWNRKYDPYSIGRDSKIKKTLLDQGLHVESFNSSLLNEPWDVMKKDGTPYQVYTAYWNVARLKINCGPTPRSRPLPPLPKKLKSSHAIKDLGLNPTIPWDSGFTKFWQPGEKHGQLLIARFLKKGIEAYGTNRDLPAIDGTSKLSPYLHFGNISPQQAWRAIEKKAETEEVSLQYQKELVWREFAAHLLFHFPHTDKEPLRPAFKKFPWKKSKSKLNAWQHGMTGYPIVDAGMRQLWHTGWMHNRVRMIVASFLIKDLQIHWREGAKWFWDTLVDADLASNSMGWQWTAGCGADAAPYFRIFNPMLQGARFDPQGVYVREWIPELSDMPDKWIHAPWDAPKDVLLQADVQLGKTYPKPIVDHFVEKVNAMAAYNNMKNSQ